MWVGGSQVGYFVLIAKCLFLSMYVCVCDLDVVIVTYRVKINEQTE